MVNDDIYGAPLVGMMMVTVVMLSILCFGNVKSSVNHAEPLLEFQRDGNCNQATE